MACGPVSFTVWVEFAMGSPLQHEPTQSAPREALAPLAYSALVQKGVAGGQCK